MTVIRCHQAVFSADSLFDTPEMPSFWWKKISHDPQARTHPTVQGSKLRLHAVHTDGRFTVGNPHSSVLSSRSFPSCKTKDNIKCWRFHCSLEFVCSEGIPFRIKIQLQNSNHTQGKHMYTHLVQTVLLGELELLDFCQFEICWLKTQGRLCCVYGIWALTSWKGLLLL